MPELPEHSPLGASSAHRWHRCPGSQALIKRLRSGSNYHEEDPDFRQDGVQAHALAAWCLKEEADTWEAPVGGFPLLTADMMAAVQMYLDHIRATTDNARLVETHLYAPEFHEAAYGTVDCAYISGSAGQGIKIDDYKHGVGVVVEVEHNWQIMYYAWLLILEIGGVPDDEPVDLTIVQPRAPWHPDGPIRTWRTTVGEIRTWAYAELLPAMNETEKAEYLDMGEHCRFCPAKVVCPAMLNLAQQAFHWGDPDQWTNEMIAERLPKAPLLRMMAKALESEAHRRMTVKGIEVEGFKVVKKMGDRVFKQDAPVVAQFGAEAWQPQKIKSPPMIEAMPGGKDFVAEWAYQPDAGYIVVPESDRRKAQEIRLARAILSEGEDVDA